VKDKRSEAVPALVSETTKQAGEARSRWLWTEPSVWTERMLTALEERVKGGRWFSLIDKMSRESTLEMACGKVRANGGAAGVDHQTVEMFAENLSENIRKLSAELRQGTYRPSAVKRVWIPKPGKRSEKRPLGIPTVRDRIVQTAMRMVMEPIFEKDFAENSFGFRPGRGCKDALRRVDALLKQGFTWIVDADLKSFFDTIDHQILMKRMEEKISDGRVLEMIDFYLHQDVLETAELWTPEAGTPQGAVISPLLSNIYLDPLDHLMKKAGFEMVRYADDFVILCRSESEALQGLQTCARWVETVNLQLHPEKTRIVEVTETEGFDFLGYHFRRNRKWPSQKSVNKFRDKIRPLTKRTHGHNLQSTVDNLNRIIRGWFEYFKHSYKPTFQHLDGWIRMRLRSILRKRERRKGLGKGFDHKRWPNAYFVELGLFSMEAARESACRSSMR
jgi:RNA-directed DNA polymerase